MTNTREQMQTQIDRWIKTIKSLEADLAKAAPGTYGHDNLMGALREYKGKIYAARAFERILGFEFNTSYIDIPA